MPTINQIGAEHIAQLNPTQLVELLRKLLYSEARGGGAAVHVPTQINVPDDGEDGRWDGEVKPSEYIPNAFCIYQSKAQELGRSDCKNAMLTRDESDLKPATKEVIRRNGCFVFFCSKPYVQLANGIEERVNAAYDALGELAQAARERKAIRFLDANKIAEWTNHHTSAILHVCKCCRITLLEGAHTWEDWSRQHAVQPKFYSNGELDKKIFSIRECFKESGRIGRVTGLSGLGKTKLAFEAFRPPSISTDVNQLVLNQTMVYVDWDNAPQDILATVDALESSQASGILIIDNCPKDKHNALAKIIRNTGCKLSLLTLDYVPESITSDHLSIDIQPELMKNVVVDILRGSQLSRALDEGQMVHIANFAQGFPQIATLMAEAGDTVDWARLNERGLAEKILWGRASVDKDALEIITLLSLFTHVGFEGDDLKPQKDFVRKVLRKPRDEDDDRDEMLFDTLLRGFRDKRILQAAGRYVMITPAPLAVALAANWWSNINPAYLKKLIPKIDEVGLTKFFCERLQQLHFSPNAQAIAAQMCGATGPLCNAEVLSSELGSRLFRTMVELNPVAAMSCLWRTFSGADFNTLRNTLEGRRNLVWALEKLCWSSDTFPQACELMLKFAWAENETWGNNATGQFKQLFHLLLSGTQVPGEERLKVIDRYVNSPEPGIRRLCLDALGEGLRTSFFSRQSGVEVRGSGLPEKDWEPKNDKEAFSYIQSCYKVLAEVAIKKTSDSDLAKQIIGSHLREILREGFLDLFEKEFRGIAKTYDNYWPEAYNSLNDIYSYDRKKFSPQSITRLKTWEKWITPKDIKYRIDKYIINAGYEHKEKPNGGFIDVSSMKAKKFANEMAKRSKLLYENIDSIQQGKQRLAFIFGCHVARKISDSKRFIEESIASLRRIPKEKRNIDLLNGFLFGSGDTKLMVSTIKSLSKDSELIFLVPAIVARLPKLEIAVLRFIFNLFLENRIPFESLSYFEHGRALDYLNSRELISLLTPFLSIAEARIHIFKILDQYAYHDDKKWKACIPLAKSIISSERFLLSLRESMDSFAWKNIAKKLLNENNDSGLAINLTKQIVDIETSLNRSFEHSDDRKEVLSEIIEKHSSVCWPIIGDKLLQPNYYLLGGLLGSHTFEDQAKSILCRVPADILVKWVHLNPKGKYIVLHMMSLFYVDAAGEHWHGNFMSLIEDGIDKEGESAIISNILSFGSSGSRVPYLEKRINLIKKLQNHPQTSVRNLAFTLEQILAQEKQKEEKRDAEIHEGIL